jgi:tungstate transport system ATP-binding protein
MVSESSAGLHPRLLPIALRGVCVDIDGQRLLHDVNLNVAKHRKLVLLGANGAGKSLLLRILHGRVVPTSGEICTPNQIDLAVRANRAYDAMLFQRPVMLRRSVIDNVRFGLDEVSNASANARANEALARVGLAALAQRAARTLSGGEQQRVAFARALARNPEVLYLDEPTASIDPQSTRQIEALINEVAAQGMTVVMVTHNLAQAKRLADDIVFMHEGRVMECTLAKAFFVQPSSTEARTYIEGETI